jgi:SRSO17 transposase
MATTSTPQSRRFDAFVECLAGAVRHADRHGPLRSYLTGLLLDGERKSVEPMAARIDPGNTRARHQSMHHFVASSPWDGDAVLAAARNYALHGFRGHKPVAAWVVDDTGFPKKGRQSVGVARQYCGVLGKQDNCQVAVTVSFVNETMSVPAAYRLYLPEAWAKDKRRREAAGVPDDVAFKTKPEIALAEIARLVAEGIDPVPVLADAGYGDDTSFRDGLRALHLDYAVGIKPGTTVWAPGTGPLAPKPYGGRGQPPKLLRRDDAHKPVTAGQLRVRAAHKDYQRTEVREEEWLLVEWPAGEAEPTKYFLVSPPRSAPLRTLVALVKLRWRIERDYEELKGETGLGHYEGRSWRGFHHHGALCIAAYCFLIAERARLSPPRDRAFLGAAALPEGFRPRGSPAAS